MLHLWRITMRHLSFGAHARFVHSKEFAIKSSNELDAVKFARENIHSPAWWEEYIVIDIELIGELWAAEGLTVPRDED